MLITGKYKISGRLEAQIVFLFLVRVFICIFFGKQISYVLCQYDCDADEDEMDMCGNGNGREMRDGSV